MTIWLLLAMRIASTAFAVAAATQWSSLSESDLAAMAYYDASPLQIKAHQAWGAAYVTGHRSNLSFDNHQLGQIPDESAVLDETGSTAFLRGKYFDSSSNRNINNNERENSKDPERQLESLGTVRTGPENDPIGGLNLTEIEQMTASAPPEQTEAETKRQELEERLDQVMEATQALNARHARYDTNEEYSYSNPNNSNSNNKNEPGSMNDMTAFSRTAQSSRQRLLTGSYASWQWYDRSKLAEPLNFNLHKVSRVNYAFFQADAEGYIFGTDKWADPNILFGSYDFSIGSNSLPEECKGGRGRIDGKTGRVANAQEQSDRADDEEEEGADGSAQDPGRGDSYANLFSSGKSHRRVQTTPTTDEASTNNNNNKDPPCTYFEQCHRNLPNSKSCHVHKYKEGLIYLAHTSGAQIYPSIGGWTLSGTFPTIAADITKRKRFAQECVGLIRDYGFDGIDIDWELGYRGQGGYPWDNFNELLLEIRAALNDYQMETGDEPLGGGSFGLTADLPCGPANIDFLDVGFLSEVLDGMNLMTFDFHNAMEPVTGANSPLYDQEWDQEPGLSVDGCVKNYYESGAGDFAEKIIIGVPFYGKTFSYATEMNSFHSNTNGQGGGKVDQGNWSADLGTPVYYNILDKISKGGMISKRHEATKTQYAYFKDGSGLVTYDDPQAVCDKADYVSKNLLGGLFVWEMSGGLMETLETPLLDSINRKLEEPNFDCRSIALPEDGAVIDLPPPAPKGPPPTQWPTKMPSISAAPTGSPSASPTETSEPTGQPTHSPSISLDPTGTPSSSPTTSTQPTESPSVSLNPTSAPSTSPTTTSRPTASQWPTTTPTLRPSDQPSIEPTAQASNLPSQLPSTSRAPTQSPTDMPSISAAPTGSPSASPTETSEPTGQLSESPSISLEPTAAPSSSPTTSLQPTKSPSVSLNPTSAPSTSPTTTSRPTAPQWPTTTPTLQSSGQPSIQPSIESTAQPSVVPSQLPTTSRAPTQSPTDMPSISAAPTGSPSASPTETSEPTGQLSESPSISLEPTAAPSSSPTTSLQPTESPSVLLNPTSAPSTSPTTTSRPTSSQWPTTTPTLRPSGQPSIQPTVEPTVQPSGAPSQLPSTSPTTTVRPTASQLPTTTPTLRPSGQPSNKPSVEPSQFPSTSSAPSLAPSLIPSLSPTASAFPTDTISPSISSVPTMKTPAEMPNRTIPGSSVLTSDASLRVGDENKLNNSSDRKDCNSAMSILLSGIVSAWLVL